MGNKKNHAKKNKRLANNGRKIIKMRKKRPNKEKLPQKANFDDKNSISGNISSSSSLATKENEIDSAKPFFKDNWQILFTTGTTIRFKKTQNNVRNNNQTYYVLQKYDQNQHTRIVRGDFHQCDVRFEELSRGKQYVATAVVALCFFKENNNPETWTTADINQILMIGDVQYHASFKKMKREGQTPQTLHLSISEVYQYIKIGRKYYCLNETDADSLHLETNVLKRNNLETSLNRFFIENQNVCGIFTCSIFSFAIMRKFHSFFLLNSCATSYDGEPIDPCDKESAACLLEMFTVTCLANYLLLASNHRHMMFDETAYDPGVSYSITSVNIHKLVFGNDCSKRKKVIRDLGMAESRGRNIERKRKSKHIGNAHAKPKRARLNPETIQGETVRLTQTQEKVWIGCGMKNLGNSCFLNACFQAFFHIPIVNIRLQNIKNRKCKCLVCNIVTVFKDTHNKKNLMSYDPTNIYGSFQQLNADLLNGKQQDAQEFWMRIMRVFENKRNSSTMFDRLFMHDVITNVECQHCLKNFETIRETSAHVIELNRRSTIQEALDAYFAGDVVESYMCSECESINYNKAKKQFFLKTAPNILCLMLNRFQMGTKKKEDDIELSKRLTVTHFAPLSETTSVNYKLVTVINHKGKNISSGHYTATACCSKNTYYEFDDDLVKSINVIRGSSAYILFYELSAKMEVDADFDVETSHVDERQYNNENESMPSFMMEELEYNNDTHARYQEIQEESENHDEENNTPSGLRIVDVGFLSEQMQYISRHSEDCDSHLIFKKETKLGFRSIFHFKCEDCGVFHQIQSSSKNVNYMNINKATTLGFTSIGSGFYHMEEVFAHMSIPCMSSSTFETENKKIQREWSELAKYHTEQALLEEIRHAIAIGSVDSAGNALITVICDGSWGKRSYGKGFSSLSGCAAIIGFYTKKVLYFGVKNKYCHTCTLSYAQNTPPNNHKCNISYDGPSSGMETEILVEGFKFCRSLGARFPKIIGDGDSSAFKEISEQCVYENPYIVIEKIECVNHLFKNARKKLTALCKDTRFKAGYRRLLKQSIGDDLCKGIRCAAKYWRESNVDMMQKLDNLEKDCLNAPYHIFGNHDKCNKYFCKKATTDGSNAKITLLKQCGIFHEILNYCNIYFASNVNSLLQDQSNNAAEELNNVIAKYLGGKRINYSLAGSYTGRVSAAVVQYNTKGHAGSHFHKFYNLSTNNYLSKIENDRIRHYAENEKARQTKPRVRAKKDKALKGYQGQKEDLSERALEVAMGLELDIVNSNRSERDLILENTFGQKHNHQWKTIRKKLINCNYFGRIINARGPKSYPKLLEEMLYSPIEWSNTAEIRHQRLYEHEALKMFGLARKKFRLEKTGIFIDDEFGFLGASPLRLYGPNSIINVQCPIKAFKKTVSDAIHKKLVPLTYKDGDIFVKDTSNWYIEIQGQLHITGRRFCYLMVWLGEEFLIKKVAVDHSFWENNMKNKLQFFFNEGMLKELANSRRGRKMELRKFDPQKNTFV